jgi:hypothetical protein
MDKTEGFLEVGISEDGREVVVNHPDLKPDKNGVGHIVFSPAQARSLAESLLAKAADIDIEGSGEYFIDFNTKQQPGKIQAVRVRLDLQTIEYMNKRMRIDLCDHPLYKELKQYVEAN